MPEKRILMQIALRIAQNRQISAINPEKLENDQWIPKQLQILENHDQKKH